MIRARSSALRHLTGAVGALTVCAASFVLDASTLHAAEPAPSPEDPTACTDPEATLASETLHSVEAAASSFDGYTGVALIARCESIAVYGLGSSPVEQFVLDTSSDTPIPVEFVPVANSGEVLNRDHQDAVDVSDELVSQGVDIVGFWPDITTGHETFSVRSPSEADYSLIKQRLGTDVVVVPYTGDAIRTTVTRAYDSAPFSAGNFISSTAGTCTSGAGVHTGTGLTRVGGMLTAGHCSTSGSGASTKASTGNTFTNNYYNESFIPTGSKLPVGYTSLNYWNQNLDAALLRLPAPSDSSTSVFSGSSTSTLRYSQSGIERALIGEEVCTSGAFEGLKCRGTVKSSFYRGCIFLQLHYLAPRKKVCAIIYATAPAIINGSGDSGGPVIMASSITQPRMAGLISAGSSKVPCLTYTFREEQGGGCFSDVFFTDLRTVAQKAGVALNRPANP